jgi:hypothetical protein
MVLETHNLTFDLILTIRGDAIFARTHWQPLYWIVLKFVVNNGLRLIEFDCVAEWDN